MKGAGGKSVGVTGARLKFNPDTGLIGWFAALLGSPGSSKHNLGTTAGGLCVAATKTHPDLVRAHRRRRDELAKASRRANR